MPRSCGCELDLGLRVGEVDLILRQIVLERRLRELQPDSLALETLLGEAGFQLLHVGRLARSRRGRRAAHAPSSPKYPRRRV